MGEVKYGDMSESQGPSSSDLMKAMVALHDFTGRGLGTLSAKIDRVDAKLEGQIDRLQKISIVASTALMIDLIESMSVSIA